jgi:hypothetical protein
MSSSNCAQSFAEKIVEIVQNAEIPVRAHVQDRRKRGQSLALFIAIVNFVELCGAHHHFLFGCLAVGELSLCGVFDDFTIERNVEAEVGAVIAQMIDNEADFIERETAVRHFLVNCGRNRLDTCH